MLRISVIILIGLLVAKGDKDIKSIETISDISNEAKLENSKIVTIKMKPNAPVEKRTSDIHHSAEPRTADDDQLIYVEIRPDDFPDSTINSDLSKLTTEINVNTRRFLTDNDSENNEESRFADQEISTIDEVERTADTYDDYHDGNHPTGVNNKEIDHSDQHPITDMIGRGAIENLYEPSSTAKSKTGETEVNRDSPNTSLVSERTGESTETPTRRRDHHNSSVLNKAETKEEPVTHDQSEHDIEIVRQGSDIIEEEDIEVFKSIPFEDARRRFNDFENYPEISIFDDDLIQTAKSRENLHDILIDTKSRSGMPQHDFNVPGHTFYFSEPNTNEYQYSKAVDYQSHTIKNINGHQPQHEPIVDYQHHLRPISPVYQPYTNKHNADNQPHNIKPTAYQSQNIPLAYELQDPNTIGGYLPYDNLLIPSYRSNNFKSSFDYQSDDINPKDGYERLYDTKPNIGFQPDITFPSRKIKSTTDYQSHTNNRYRPQDVSAFNGHQLKIPTGNYPPQFDYLNSLTDYPPFNIKSYICLKTHRKNRINTIYQPHTRPFANQRYNIKPMLGFQPYGETKPLGDYHRYNIKTIGLQTLAGYKPHAPTTGIQSHVTPTTGYQPPHVKSLPYQSPNIRRASYQSPANASNKSTANYQSPTTPVTGFQPYNTYTTNQHLNVEPHFNHQLHASKAIFDNNRLLESRWAAYHTQDTSSLASSSLHPRNEQTYHPVYGNHHHYIPQHLLPKSPMITMTPIPMALNPELPQKPCKTGICYSVNRNLGTTAVNIMNPLNYANGIHLPGLHNGLNFNANLGFLRNILPYRRNSRIILNSHQYPRHLVSSRSVDTESTSEERYASSEDEVEDNNYPNINRHKNHGFNTYNYEATNANSYFPLEPLSLRSNIYRSTTTIENHSDKSGSLESAEHLHNNPLEAIVPDNNLLITKTEKSLGPNDFHPIVRNNSLYEPRGLNNNLRGSQYNPYEPRDLGNIPYELRGLGNNPYEFNVRSFEPYRTLPAMFQGFNIG